MNGSTYDLRRTQLETYFDRTAAEAWSRLTSDAPVSKIRATVRAGRERMRSTLLGWLPQRLDGCRILDAGCGTGAFATEAARRGAHVVAVDVATTLVELARERKPADIEPGNIEFLVGDMLDPGLGRFDYVVAMDSMIHYDARDTVRMLGSLAQRVDVAMLFTFAPRTPALSLMHLAGRLFPRGDRAPAIVPVGEGNLRKRISTQSALREWQVGNTLRISSGFYTSQAMELVRG